MDDLTAVERRELQRMIDRTVKAQNGFYEAQHTLNEWCLGRYGRVPGDIDADQIIDGVFGGNGAAGGMRAGEFHQIMSDG